MSETQLEVLLSNPTLPVVAAVGELQGDVVVLGAGGKMGPSLARLARRAMDQAGVSHRVFAVSRFSDEAVRATLEAAGVHTMACDLYDPAQVSALPDVPHVVYMVGRKFGTGEDPAATWKTNTHLPTVAAQRFPEAQIVAFSTGNVYPLTPAGGPGPSETDPTGPVGPYAESALAREGVFTEYAVANRTRMTILRLNYAIEPRYGILRDIADRVRAGEAVDVSMGWVNVIWQRDANAVALRSFSHARVPPMILNLTGRPAVSVRWIAEQFGRRWGVKPKLVGTERDTALLSDASKAERLFGAPDVSVDQMINYVAEWIEAGGRSLGKPTHFERRDGEF